MLELHCELIFFSHDLRKVLPEITDFVLGDGNSFIHRTDDVLKSRHLLLHGLNFRLDLAHLVLHHVIILLGCLECFIHLRFQIRHLGAQLTSSRHCVGESFPVVTLLTWCVVVPGRNGLFVRCHLHFLQVLFDTVISRTHRLAAVEVLNQRSVPHSRMLQRFNCVLQILLRRWLLQVACESWGEVLRSSPTSQISCWRGVSERGTPARGWGRLLLIWMLSMRINWCGVVPSYQAILYLVMLMLHWDVAVIACASRVRHDTMMRCCWTPRWGRRNRRSERRVPGCFVFWNQLSDSDRHVFFLFSFLCEGRRSVKNR